MGLCSMHCHQLRVKQASRAERCSKMPETHRLLSDRYQIHHLTTLPRGWVRLEPAMVAASIDTQAALPEQPRACLVLEELQAAAAF